VASDETLRIVVLRGQGDDFCCGADIDAAAAGDHTACGDPDPYKVTQLLHAMPAVTLAAIRGGCAGAALGWACACDIRIASHSARFNTAFLKMGLAGDMAGIWFLTRLIGPTRARDLYLFPRKFSAQDAYSIGMLTRIAPDVDFESLLNQMVDQLACSAPLALKAIKANFLDAEHLDLEAFIAVETSRHRALYVSADSREAFKAFLEKRKPHFEGR
jgi:2-(1,2-epoxy-1,2-dihydrophenyl)acetyl-CoA isomerase